MRRPLVLLLLFACEATDADEGLDASLHVERAQFFRGAMPGDSGGPAVKSVTVGTTFAAGANERTCIGETDRAGVSVAIGLDGDLGYWVVRADPPSAGAPDAPTFRALLGFSAKMRPGPRDLVVRAVDGDRRFGPADVKPITITERGLPEGELVVALAWDDKANLDLHVVDPTGAEIFKRDINSYQGAGPNGPREAPNTPHDGGVLDFDSNAECVYDGRRAENVVWTDPPPRGHYVVRVDTFSLCGEPAARWTVRAVLRGRSIASSEGVGTDVDTTFAHDRGAGVLALEFDVP